MTITKNDLKYLLKKLNIKVRGNCIAKSDLKRIMAEEDPMWTENKELRKAIKQKVKGIKSIEDSHMGIGSFVAFPANIDDFHVQVNIVYDSNRKFKYAVFKIVDGKIEKSKRDLTTRDQVVSLVESFF